MKVIIAGGRNFNDYPKLDMEVSSILNSMGDIPKEEIEIVSGGASGADRLGELYAQKNGFPLKVIEARWEEYGKSAGPRRNKRMALYAGRNGVLIAFWNQKSAGTRSMISEAERVGLRIHIINY